MEDVPHPYLIYVVNYVLVVQQATLQPERQCTVNQSASVFYGLQGELTLFEGSSFGFPSGTTTPSSVIFDSAVFGAIWPTPLVLHRNNCNPTAIFMLLISTHYAVLKGEDNKLLKRFQLIGLCSLHTTILSLPDLV